MLLDSGFLEVIFKELAVEEAVRQTDGPGESSALAACQASPSESIS